MQKIKQALIEYKEEVLNYKMIISAYLSQRCRKSAYSLINLLKESHEFGKSILVVIEALVKLRALESVEALIEQLKNNKDLYVKVAIIKALGNLKDKKAKEENNG